MPVDGVNKSSNIFQFAKGQSGPELGLTVVWSAKTAPLGTDVTVSFTTEKNLNGGDAEFRFYQKGSGQPAPIEVFKVSFKGKSGQMKWKAKAAQSRKYNEGEIYCRVEAGGYWGQTTGLKLDNAKPQQANAATNYYKDGFDG